MTRHRGATRFWLIGIFIIYSSFIVCQSIFDSDGFLSSDSAHYLQLAHNLLAGNGLTTVNFVPDMSTYFATWPSGYPLLIAIVALLPLVNLFWAAKLVNIIFFGLCLVVFYRLFKQRAPVIAMVFFISTFTNIFTYTWSEVPFLFGMVWLVYGIVSYIETNKLSYALQMVLAALLMFFTRYIGLMGAGVIGLIGFYYLFSKQWRNMIVCFIAGSIPIIMAGAYLLVNFLKTGTFTGMERIPRAETMNEFFVILWKGLLAEFNMFSTSSQVYVLETAIILIVVGLIFIRPRHIRALINISYRKFLLPGMFLLVGSVYFIAIVYMRWTAHFNIFDFRLLGPATLMIWLFFISWLAQVSQHDWLRWRNFLVFVLGLAFIMNVGYQTYTSIKSPTPTYIENKQIIQHMYEKIPAESIVALENIHARYLRPDLQYIKVYFRPYFSKRESVEDFVNRITPNDAKGVYFQVGPISEDRYHESIIDLLNEADSDVNFIKLK